MNKRSNSRSPKGLSEKVIEPSKPCATDSELAPTTPTNLATTSHQRRSFSIVSDSDGTPVSSKKMRIAGVPEGGSNMSRRMGRFSIGGEPTGNVRLDITGETERLSMSVRRCLFPSEGSGAGEDSDTNESSLQRLTNRVRSENMVIMTDVLRTQPEASEGKSGRREKSKGRLGFRFDQVVTRSEKFLERLTQMETSGSIPKEEGWTQFFSMALHLKTKSEKRPGVFTCEVIWYRGSILKAGDKVILLIQGSSSQEECINSTQDFIVPFPFKILLMENIEGGEVFRGRYLGYVLGLKMICLGPALRSYVSSLQLKSNFLDLPNIPENLHQEMRESRSSAAKSDQNVNYEVPSRSLPLASARHPNPVTDWNSLTNPITDFSQIPCCKSVLVQGKVTYSSRGENFAILVDKKSELCFLKTIHCPPRSEVQQFEFLVRKTRDRIPISNLFLLSGRINTNPDRSRSLAPVLQEVKCVNC